VIAVATAQMTVERSVDKAQVAEIVRLVGGVRLAPTVRGAVVELVTAMLGNNEQLGAIALVALQRAAQLEKSHLVEVARVRDVISWLSVEGTRSNAAIEEMRRLSSIMKGRGLCSGEELDDLRILLALEGASEGVLVA